MLVKMREISKYHMREQSQECRNERGDLLNTFFEHCFTLVLSYSSGYPTASVTLCQYIYVHMSDLDDTVKHQQPVIA